MFMQFIFDCFFPRPRYRFTKEELAIVNKLIADANIVASGAYLEKDKWPDPIIPDRRRNKR